MKNAAPLFLHRPPFPPPDYPYLPDYPTPPSPPPFTLPNWPLCRCDRSASHSRLSLTPSATAFPKTLANGFNSYCFTLTVAQLCATPGSPCCNQASFKIEFALFNATACYGSLAYTTVNGAMRAPQYISMPYGSVKVTGVGKDISTADGTEVCVVLKHSPCGTAQMLFGPYLVYAVFNNPSTEVNKCCPVSYIGI